MNFSLERFRLSSDYSDLRWKCTSESSGERSKILSVCLIPWFWDSEDRGIIHILKIPTTATALQHQVLTDVIATVSI